jgi:ClpP class serine protease
MVHREEHGTKHRHRPYITIEDSEEILYSIRSTRDDTPIDFILHCPGGIVMPAKQIAIAVNRHPASVSVIVPHYAMSGATLIALAAKEIVMDPYSVLGPLDPQINGYPSPSLIKLKETKKTDFVSDEMLLLADIATKSVRQMKALIISLTRDRVGSEKAATIAEFLTEGYLTHNRPITAQDAQSLGLPVKIGVSDEIHQLMRLYKYASEHHGSWYSVPCGM